MSTSKMVVGHIYKRNKCQMVPLIYSIGKMFLNNNSKLFLKKCLKVLVQNVKEGHWPFSCKDNEIMNAYFVFTDVK